MREGALSFEFRLEFALGLPSPFVRGGDGFLFRGILFETDRPSVWMWRINCALRLCRREKRPSLGSVLLFFDLCGH